MFAADEPANPHVVPTYECASVYWEIPDAGACHARYRQGGAGAWREALDLVFDSRDGQYRGSLVGLEPDTAYELELHVGDRIGSCSFRTRSDRFPIGRTTVLPAGETGDPVVITQSGTPEAYHLVTVPDGSHSTLNLANGAPNGIEIDADYVIVRGVEVRNAGQNAILIRENRHDIVIEECRLWFWGRIGGPISFGNVAGNLDSGIFARDGTSNLTLQRNLIEDPRGAANNWERGHPAGPQAISIMRSRGGNVIRYNEIWSTEDHGFNDGIGGGPNFSATGNMNRDSDIYGNIIRNCWDDSIECEGANMNVRIWGNYIDHFFVGVATASTSRGPLYIFRNVFGLSRRSHENPLGNALIKTGTRGEFGGGRIYVFHNTARQPRGALNVFNNRALNTVTRNNIFDVPGSLIARHEVDPSSDHDYDLFTGADDGGAKEPHGQKTPPAFVESYRLEFYPASITIKHGGHKVPLKIAGKERTVTNPVLEAPNPAIDGGVALAGFNDGFVGRAPDLGAFEVGAPPLEFGRRAYLRYDEGWAPWERD